MDVKHVLKPVPFKQYHTMPEEKKRLYVIIVGVIPNVLSGVQQVPLNIWMLQNPAGKNRLREAKRYSPFSKKFGKKVDWRR
jgi:hypothetical protein